MNLDGVFRRNRSLRNREPKVIGMRPWIFFNSLYLWLRIGIRPQWTKISKHWKNLFQANIEDTQWVSRCYCFIIFIVDFEQIPIVLFSWLLLELNILRPFSNCTIAVIPKELCLWICFVLVWATHDSMNFRHNVQVYPPSLWASLVRYKWVLKWFLHTKCHLINTDNCMQTLRTKASNVKHDNSTNKINIFKF